MRLALILAALAVAPIAAMAQGRIIQPGPSQRQQVRPQSGFTMAGALSGIRQPRQVVVRDEKAWQALWKEHLPNGGTPLPAVDFKKQDVIAVFAGMERTGGYRVTIDEVKRSGKSATVLVTLHKPARGTMTTQMITYPFVMQSVDKLPQTVRFELKEQ